ncbi:MAG: putative membrane protein [Myxococcota bacterium]|jgi:uncharacterized membrane protein
MLLLGLIGAVGGCSTDSSDDSVELPADCTTLYEPTFDNVHTRTLQVSCALAGGACHAAEGGQGGLVLAGIDDAYSNLLGAGRVIADDAASSLLLQRLYTTDGSKRMPPGNALSDEERCAVLQWVNNGAER